MAARGAQEAIVKCNSSFSSAKQLPNYIYNSTDTYHETADKW